MLSDYNACPQSNSIINRRGDDCHRCEFKRSQLGGQNYFLSGINIQSQRAIKLPLGSTLLDRFVLKDLIGSGRFGTVYTAEDHLRSKQVAIKVTNISSYGQQFTKEHLLRDIKTNELISDFSYIIHVFDLHVTQWQNETILLLPMELADGGTLRDWITANKENLEIRQKEGLSILKQACLGIQSGHSTGVIHLDIKPENLMFCNGILKVADFGMAQLLGSFNQSATHFYSTIHSETGTPTYMSPEQFIAPHPDDVDHRADIYSIGIILYELLHPKCRPPFSGSYYRIRDLHLSGNPPPLSNVNDRLNNIVSRCLDKNPDNRYQGIDELLIDLDSVRTADFASQNELKPDETQIAEHIDQLWSKATLLYEQGCFRQLSNIIDEIIKYLPDDFDAHNLKHEIEERYVRANQFYDEILNHLEGDLSELIPLLEEAVNTYPEHPAGHIVQIKLTVKTQKYSRFMQEGSNALQADSWEDALVCFENAAKYNPSSENLIQIVDRLTWIKNTKNKIDAALHQENFELAITLARYVDHYIDEMKKCIPVIKKGSSDDEN